MKESHPQQPLSPYGVAKRVVTDYLHVYRELHSIEFTSLAMANIYGPRQDPHGEAGVVAIFAGLLLDGKPCTVFGDGEQTRDFVYVDDAVDAFVRAADRGSGLLCNIGTGTETSVNQLYAAMAEAAGVTDPPVHAPPRPGELQRERRSIPAGPSLHLGWEPWTDLADRRRRGPPLVPRLSGDLAEEVLVRRADDLGVHLAAAEPRRVDPSHDGGGDARRPCPSRARRPRPARRPRTPR